MARQQQEREKSASQRERTHRRDNSPYSKNFKCYIKSDERDLIYKRQTVTKLSRKDLEDKYIELCDENFFIKRQNNELQDKVKELTTKIVRISSGLRSYSSSAILRERTSENIAESSRCTTRLQSSFSKPMARSASLQTVFRRNAHSATPSERSKVSSTSTNSHESAVSNVSETNQNAEKGISEVSEKDLHSKEEVKALKKKIEDLELAIKVEHEKYTKVETEKRNAESQLSDIDMKKFIMENIEINRLKRKLDQVKIAVKRMQTHHKQVLLDKNEFIEMERKKFTRIIDQLNEDSAVTLVPNDRTNEFKSALRTVEMLRKQIAELEFDKKTLMDQQESLSGLLKRAAAYQNKDNKTHPLASTENSKCLQDLEQLKTEKAAIENSKNELFVKIRELQDTNDRLVVDLEGLKTMRNLREGLQCDGNADDSDVIILLSENVDTTGN